jgi:hypothetical protein
VAVDLHQLTKQEAAVIFLVFGWTDGQQKQLSDWL